MGEKKLIFDACCGSKMFWFNKNHPNTIYMDNRKEKHILCDGRKLEINPDVIADFKNIPYPDDSFKLVIFDPPQLKLGKNSWMAKKYGSLSSNWKEEMQKGFNECWRVLDQHGILIFKWNETDIPIKKILSLIKKEPLFGNKRGKLSKTHWLCFMKI